MPLLKRGRIYYADVTVKGERVVRSLQTTDRKEAQEAHDKIRAELWRTIALGETPEVLSKTLKDAIRQYMIDADRRNVKDTVSLNIQVEFMLSVLGNVMVNQITKADLTTVIRAKIDDGARYRAAGDHNKNHARREVSNATLNRYIGAMISLMNFCHNQGWLSNVPTIKKFPEKKRRVRFLTQEQASKLLSVMPVGVVKSLAEFSLETGLRQHNATHLEWDRVDLSKRIAWIEADMAKGEKLIPIQLSARAVEILNEQSGKHPIWVFPVDGKPVENPASKMWKTCLKNAGIENFRWHDLRHTWASWHVQNGTPLPVLQELGGWSSYQMVQKYAHLAPSHLAGYADNSGVRHEQNDERKAA